jgi:sugar/nucleoside kinase (ribokinase family)
VSVIVCLGDVMVDVVAHLSGPLAVGSDRAARTALHGGGSAANTASWLAAAGAEAVLIGRVGADLLGTWSLAQLGRELAAGVGVDPSAPTGTCVVLVTPDGERSMAPDPGANATLRPAHLTDALFGPGHHLHVSGYSVFGAARDAAVEAMARARAAGMTVSVGAASAAPLAAMGAAEFLGAIGTDLLLFANRDEGEVLTGSTDPMIAAATLAGQVGQAVVTAGDAGAAWARDGECRNVTVEPLPPSELIDSTGAGDAFAAGVLNALSAGQDLDDAVTAGHRLAVAACRVPGGRPPRRVSHRR